MADRWLSASEAAQRLSLSVSYTRSLLASERIKGEKDADGRWRVRESLVEAEWKRRFDPRSSHSRQPPDAALAANPEEGTEKRKANSGPLPRRSSSTPFLGYLRRARERREADRRWQRDRDPADNERSTPPASESLSLRWYWTGEIYTPATVGSLMEKLQDHDEALAWLSNERKNPAGGSWINLGWGHPDSEIDGFFRRGFPLDKLVHAIAGVHLSLMSVGPAVTVLAAGFKLNESGQKILDNALNARYATFSEQTKRFARAHRIHDPVNQKRSAVADAVESLADDCSQVINRNLPGTSERSGLGRAGFFVLTTTEIEPLAMTPSDFGGYVNTADLGDQSVELKSGPWRLTENWLSNRGTRPEGVGLIAGREGEVLNALTANSFGSELENLDVWMTYQMHGLTSRWVLNGYLDNLQERLGQQRDERASGSSDSGGIRELDLLRRDLIEVTLDAHSVVRDVQGFVDNEHSYKWSVWDFEGTTPFRNEEDGPWSFVEALRSNTKWKADHLEQQEKAISNLLKTDAELRSAITNLRFQRTVRWLTLIALIVSIVTLAIAAWATQQTQTEDSLERPTSLLRANTRPTEIFDPTQHS